MTDEQKIESGVAINDNGVTITLPDGSDAQLELTAKLLEDCPELMLGWAQLILQHQMILQQSAMAQALTAMATAFKQLTNPEYSKAANQARMDEAFDMAFKMVERMAPGLNLTQQLRNVKPNGGG